MLLLLVRHGQSVFNAQGKLAGQADVGLSEHGREQVAALAPVVAKFAPDRVVCSDLLRTRQTAEILGCGGPVSLPALREMDLGEWTSAEVGALQAGQPEHYAAWRAGRWTPPGGEDWDGFSRRVEDALAEVMGTGERVLVVTHGGVVRAACSLLLDLPVSRLVPVNPASLTVVSCGAAARLVTYNTSAETEVIASHQ